MEQVEDFVDSRQKAWCIHCTRSLVDVETNNDHVPTKSLLRKPRPQNLPVVTICRECNNGFSRDEQYLVTFLSCVRAGTTEPGKQKKASAARALAGSTPFRAHIEKSRNEYRTHCGDTRVVWTPDMPRIERVILKNARGHAYFEYGEPMLAPPAYVWALPLESLTDEERDEFEGLHDQAILAGWPEVGSRMLTRLLTGQDMVGEWIVVQDGIYRYSVRQEGGLRVRSILSEYLATEVRWDE